jgi:YbgC/YbaW family acyl-CoA thioester hydrolase
MSHDIHTFLLKSELGFPVINATGHYYKPVKLYERLKCQLRVSHMGQTSVQFNYKFINDLEELTFEATLVQVCIDNHTKLKKELPDFLIQVFSLIYEK